MIFRVTCLLLISLNLPASSTQPAMDAKTRGMLEQWKPKLEAEKLRFLIAPPFVIAGDGSMAQLRGYRHHTIVAAMQALEKAYFDRPPQEPILILLFESDEPYRRLSKKWFGSGDVPHFGYYRHSQRVMVMNVATGTGTLVHELTHALIEPDFPGVPSWFNEGLASLYEQCVLEPDSIRGLVNWRLPALQKAIRENKLRSIEQLIGDNDFYRTDLVGLNYAQARYLLFYLQEKHLLRDFYRHFRDHVTDDPDGLKSLRQVISPQPLAEFEQDWRKWVLELADKLN